MRNYNKIAGIVSGTLLFVLFVLFIVAQRTWRFYLSLLMLAVLIFMSIFWGKKWPRRIAAILVSVLLIFVLQLCLAPGIMKPIFFAMERMRFSVVRPVYEKDIGVLKSQLALSGKDYSGGYSSVPNHLKFFASTVKVREEDGHLMVFYITEWDKFWGYAWISDPACREWLETDFYQTKAVTENWYYVNMYH